MLILVHEEDGAKIYRTDDFPPKFELYQITYDSKEQYSGIFNKFEDAIKTIKTWT